MYRILYVGNRVQSITSGYDQLNQRNICFLDKLTGGHYDVEEFSNETIWDKLSLHVGGTTYELKNRLLRRLECKKTDIVFFSSSLQGALIKAVKLAFPSLKVVCNFHNIERHYAKEFVKVSGIRHCPFYLSAYLSEAIAVQYMDYSIVLNERDALLLKLVYNKPASLILPIAVNDSFSKSSMNAITVTDEIIYLFVGVAFFANLEAVRWFISFVLPYVPGKLIVIGKDMDSMGINSERVEVLGYVPDLSFYYYKANFIISPILSGGGMKTKIAEALMYGKTILGTSEAFEGYSIVEKAMYVCNSALEYINTIRDLINTGAVAPYNETSRNLYLSMYSIEIVFDKFKSFFIKNGYETCW